VGEPVVFDLCRPCIGDEVVQFEWDFESDGSVDQTTGDAWTETAYSRDGFVVVTLTTIDVDGREESCQKGILVGASPLIAVRKVAAEGNGVFYVLVTVVARQSISAPGIEESIPVGWRVEVLDSGGAISPKLEDRTLQVVWGSSLLAGENLQFSYRLYPSYGSASPPLAGIVSGIALKRVKAEVCGDQAIPR